VYIQPLNLWYFFHNPSNEATYGWNAIVLIALDEDVLHLKGVIWTIAGNLLVCFTGEVETRFSAMLDCMFLVKSGIGQFVDDGTRQAPAASRYDLSVILERILKVDELS
jgi:hypothetical protein